MFSFIRSSIRVINPFLLLVLMPMACLAQTANTGEIPITCASEEAKAAFGNLRELWLVQKDRVERVVSRLWGKRGAYPVGAASLYSC